jgi:hypothetical protein
MDSCGADAFRSSAKETRKANNNNSFIRASSRWIGLLCVLKRVKAAWRSWEDSLTR